MIGVSSCGDERYQIFVSGGHGIVMDEIVKSSGLDHVDVLGRVLDLCLSKSNFDSVLKGIANVMEREDGRMGRR